MNRLLKTFLLWLLMAVLPLNAVASAMGMSCGALHGNDGQAAMSQAAVHHGGDHAASHGHGHDTGPAAAEASAGADTDAGHDLSHSTCSACSAFCVGAVAPPPALLPAPSLIGAEIVVISPSPFAAGFIPDGDKRPPRHLSA